VTELADRFAPDAEPAPRIPPPPSPPESPPEGGLRGVHHALNGRHHLAALMVFTLVVLSHWAEHAAQAYQIWVLHEPLKEARGVLGKPFPWLVQSEWLHYGYAVVMLVGLLLLRQGFTGRARTWWTVAFVIQFWHHIEHLLLLVQKISGHFLDGRPVPTSIAQLAFPRVELHLFYNTIVTIPMAIAMVLYIRKARRVP
jgi:hypothetical protein